MWAAVFPLLFIVVVPFSFLGWTIYSAIKTSKVHAKWREKHEIEIPSKEIERVARAMCMIAGENPDGPAGDMSGGYAWEYYVKDAKKSIASFVVLSDVLSKRPTQGSGFQDRLREARNNQRHPKKVTTSYESRSSRRR